MKKIFPFLVAALFVCSLLQAQTLVPTTVQPRNAVLEEFTGINCPNCPDGHQRAQAMYNAHPGRVVLINVHTNAYGTPSAGQPDFRTTFGEALASFAGVAAYPSGAINRHVFPGAYNAPPFYPQNPPGNMALRRLGWANAGDTIMDNGGNSPVNIGVSSTWTASTRTLSVTVELYYTATLSGGGNKINVALTQNGIIGYQSGGSSSYNHRHVLRHLLTGQWGDAVSTTTMGTFVTRTYSYVVPTTYVNTTCNIDSCEISVFVTGNDNKEIYTGIHIPAKNGSTTGTQNSVCGYSSLSLYPNPTSGASDLSFTLSKTLPVSYDIYDIRGVLVSHKDAGTLPAGDHVIAVDLQSPAVFPSGIYLMKINYGNEVITKKLIKY